MIMSKIELGMILKERYKITNQLGTGGMGEVVLAQDLTLDTPVAVKINHNVNETTSAQFIREARLLAGIKHSNLPRVIDYFTDDDSQYLVMDYIPGDDLKTVVERHDKLTTDMIIKWAVDLGNALTYLHTHKPPIFHRDIKPANIKLTPAGDVVLVDFGIAKTGDPTQETQTGAWAFSPGFAPPEQVSGMRTGAYSDQYSLAATVYYLFTNKPPADSAQRMMGAINYIPLAQVNPSVSDTVSDVIGKALSIRPEDRYASVADFLTSLTNPDATMRSDAQKTVIATRSGTAPLTGPRTPIPPRPKSKVPAVILGIIAVLIVLVGGYFALTYMGLIGPLQAATATATIPAATTMAIVLPSETVLPTATILQPTDEPTQTEVMPSATPEATTAAAVPPIGHGGKVAFSSNRQADGYFQIWLMDVDLDANVKPIASNFQQLTTTPGDKTQPNWSPDGTKLLFTAPSTLYAKNGTPYALDIWEMDVTQPDTPAIDLTNRAGNDQDPVWSPSGKKIAFTSYARDDGMPQIYLMNADGSTQERVSVQFAEHSPTWTPNDTLLLYVMDFNGHKVLSMRDIWSAYKNTKKFDMSSDAGRLGLVTDPKVSIDGQLIAYTRTIGTKSNIYTTDYVNRGSSITQLTDSDKDSEPYWSPDGKWVLFTSTRDDNSEIYLIGSDGTSLTNLTNHPAEDKDPAWEPISLSH
jgi:serine/threonine protein kinase